ncbi:MAG: Nif3-like dinuclear metal center hexameric protein [Acidobacteria bacterium]|nr:Nif3-like dinuclear metal center hexameric protein [Acidobacteriota bacterium]
MILKTKNLRTKDNVMPQIHRPVKCLTSIAVAGFLVALIATNSTFAQSNPPTARQIVKAIQDHVGVPWNNDTVDTFKAGNPDMPVTGIAVTMMATMDVLERAAANHENFVITHEPTFYNHLDVPEGISQNDPVWSEKRAFIEKHNMVVWRFHDHWHERNPDGILEGMVHVLDWGKYQRKDFPYGFTLHETTVQKLAQETATRLGSSVLRVVGNPDMKVTKIALSPGAAGFERETHVLERDDVEVLLLGETREWETIEYAADAVTEGKRKALIVIGHIPSEQAGMEECTRWLQAFVTNVKIEFVPAKQPFWLPK